VVEIDSGQAMPRLAANAVEGRLWAIRARSELPATLRAMSASLTATDPFVCNAMLTKMHNARPITVSVTKEKCHAHLTP
jgi:hypothetical protein